MISKEAQYEDMQDLLLGEKLGVGIHRLVGAFKPDTTLVIKCATECPNVNFLEWEIWQSIQHSDLAKWFAPCVQISECGMFMLQKRVEHRPRSEYPKTIPSFFGDQKFKNYGWLDGKFVCCDYAGFISTSMSHKWSGRMKKADWWE